MCVDYREQSASHNSSNNNSTLHNGQYAFKYFAISFKPHTNKSSYTDLLLV